MSQSQDMERARQRATVVFAVRSGQITVEEGARRLGVSRKTYYEWESRALQAMTEAMEERPAGRPALPADAEKEELKARVQALEHQLTIAKKTVEVRDLLHAYEMQCEKEKKRGSTDSKKKPK
jgi:transposase-like protein